MSAEPTKSLMEKRVDLEKQLQSLTDREVPLHSGKVDHFRSAATDRRADGPSDRSVSFLPIRASDERATVVSLLDHRSMTVTGMARSRQEPLLVAVAPASMSWSLLMRSFRVLRQ